MRSGYSPVECGQLPEGCESAIGHARKPGLADRIAQRREFELDGAKLGERYGEPEVRFWAARARGAEVDGAKRDARRRVGECRLQRTTHLCSESKDGMI